MFTLDTIFIRAHADLWITLLEQTDNQKHLHMTVLIRTSNNIKQLTPIFFTCLFMFSRIRDRSQKT